MNGVTERLAIRPFNEADAGLMLELVNDADWLRFIGEKNVHSLDNARRYLREARIAVHAQQGLVASAHRQGARA